MSFTEARKAIAEQKADAMTCAWCGQSTPAATLSSYGRCGACYAEYCRAPAPQPERSIYASELRAEIARKKGES